MNVIGLIASSTAIGLGSFAALIHPTPKRLKALATVERFEVEPTWLGAELADLGQWLKSVLTSGGAIVLAAVAGVMFGAVDKSDDVLEALGLIVVALSWAGVGMVTVWSGRFGRRLRLVAVRHPEIGLPEISTGFSVVLGLVGGAGLSGAASQWLSYVL